MYIISLIKKNEEFDIYFIFFNYKIHDNKNIKYKII